MLVHNISEGVDNTSLEATLAELALVDGKLRLISKHKNAALIDAELEVTSLELQQIENKIIKYDLDLDGIQDQLNCNYWERWGAVSCNLSTSKFGEVNLSGACNRVGILKSVSNGMHDLVCNRTDILRWNQKELEYVWPE